MEKAGMKAPIKCLMGSDLKDTNTEKAHASGSKVGRCIKGNLTTTSSMDTENMNYPMGIPTKENEVMERNTERES